MPLCAGRSQFLHNPARSSNVPYARTSIQCSRRNLLSETTYTISVGITLIRGEGEEHALVVNKALAFMVYRENSEEASGTLHRTGLIDPQLEWSMEMKPYAIRA